MRNLEFGFDTGETLTEELLAARSRIDVNGLASDSIQLKLPPTPSTVITTTEFFIQMAATLRQDIAIKLVKLDAVRKAAYGLDAVANIQTHPNIGVTINDYELSLISRALNSDLFTIYDINKNNRANSFMMVNNMVARKIIQDNPNDFSDIPKSKPLGYIYQEIVKPIRKGQLPEADIQYGLLSGFPQKSVKLYPTFNLFRKRFPLFSSIYFNYLNSRASANDVLDVILELPITKKDKEFLQTMLAEHARFNDRSAILLDQYIMLSKEDLHYGKRRQHWFRHLDSIYKPIMMQLGN
jgi:hypothetical protein